MPELEARYPCPVCLGTSMEKVRVGDRGLVLDHCGRCGGIWFEYGEVQQLRHLPRQALEARIPPRTSPVRVPCHSCHAPMERSADRCSACGWVPSLGCPTCEQPMKTQEKGALRIDYCTRCKGAWFDHEELAEIWRLSLSPSVRNGRGGRIAREVADGAGDVLTGILIFSPELLFYGARAAGHAVSASAEALSRAPEAAGGLMEVAGEAASSVFEVILSILEGLFD